MSLRRQHRRDTTAWLIRTAAIILFFWAIWEVVFSQNPRWTPQIVLRAWCAYSAARWAAWRVAASEDVKNAVR